MNLWTSECNHANREPSTVLPDLVAMVRPVVYDRDCMVVPSWGPDERVSPLSRSHSLANRKASAAVFTMRY